MTISTEIAVGKIEMQYSRVVGVRCRKRNAGKKSSSAFSWCSDDFEFHAVCVQAADDASISVAQLRRTDVLC